MKRTQYDFWKNSYVQNNVMTKAKAPWTFATHFIAVAVSFFCSITTLLQIPLCVSEPAESKQFEIQQSLSWRDWNRLVVISLRSAVFRQPSIRDSSERILFYLFYFSSGVVETVRGTLRVSGTCDMAENGNNGVSRVVAGLLLGKSSFKKDPK